MCGFIDVGSVCNAGVGRGVYLVWRCVECGGVSSLEVFGVWGIYSLKVCGVCLV